MKNKAIILVAVRLKSKRLKNKALLNLFGKPLIVQLTQRLKRSKLSTDIIWCTSKKKVDDKLEILAKKINVKIYRGDPKDVMKRFILAAKKFKAKNIVRVTGDNPLTDPEIIDFMIKSHLKNKKDYTSCNSIPFGTRSEVISLNILKKCHSMLEDPNSIMGLGDGGAHVGFILDAGYPTWLLSYWTRDKKLFSLEDSIRRLTSDTAAAIGLYDRGILKEGLKADINILDIEKLGSSDPFMLKDLPAGGGRLMQKTSGYVVNIVSGKITYENGKKEINLPGKLVKLINVQEQFKEKDLV